MSDNNEPTEVMRAPIDGERAIVALRDGTSRGLKYRLETGETWIHLTPHDVAALCALARCKE